MTNHSKSIFIFIIISVCFPQYAFAVGDTISGIATRTGELAKEVGKTVGIGKEAATIDQEATLALNTLVKTSPAAAELSKKAKAILVFPRILKAGLGIGGHHGNGVLRKDGKTIGYYNTVAGSYGLQVGAQSFGYVMFFMDDKGYSYLLNHNDGWEVGVGPSVVFLDEGMAKTMNNTTMTESVYVFTFNQKGLMAGAGIQGSKITKINL